MSIVNRLGDPQTIVYTIGPVGPALNMIAVGMKDAEQMLADLIDLMPANAALHMVRHHEEWITAARKTLDRPLPTDTPIPDQTDALIAGWSSPVDELFGGYNPQETS